ncbi:MAG: glycoside hydrolase family 15 protein [Capsulimonadaceae bacterium]
MPRDIALGNAEMLINLDRHLSIRDIYYPYVGWANHVCGYKCRVGVWVADGGFCWLDDSWDWQIKYEPNTLATACSARHHGLGLRLKASHAVLHDRNIFLQRFVIENMRETAREVRLFFAHDLRIDESDIGDTAFFYPFESAMVHYKRNRYFLFTGIVGIDPEAVNNRIVQYACGEKGFRGAEGTWRDAEDGQLSMNAIAQGSVDSVVGFTMHVAPKGSESLRVWLAAGTSLDAVVDMHAPLRDGEFDKLFVDTMSHWRSFVSGRRDLDPLPDRVAELFNRSLLIIRTQADKRGAIIASNDSDIMETARAHYSYMWPRDGALACYALDRLGVREITEPFFEFCVDALPAGRAALLHKYGPDGTVGASWHPWVVPSGEGAFEIPFQEDGTALVVWAIYHHFVHYQDRELTEHLYDSFVAPAADFIASFREPVSGLPLPSWDIWEERRGIHIFTTAAVIASLKAASALAAAFHKEHSSERFRTAAAEIQAALLEYFWDEKAGHFARMVNFDRRGELVRDSTVDASSYALFAFDVLAADDPKVVATMQAIGRRLWVRVGAGGVARYERDWYFHVTEDFEKVPGNPWVICTLWLADWYIATAKSESDLRCALDLIEWASVCALRTGVLSEQVHPFTLQPLSVAPLTWSHAQFITTTTSYLDKLAELKLAPPPAKD